MNEHAKVLFFATLREKAGVRETSIEFPHGTTIKEIKTMLWEKYPRLRQNMDTIIVAMDHEYAFDENIVPDGAEIAIFPPVSGGSKEKPGNRTIVALSDKDLDINPIVEELTQNTTGAACIFSGIVRGVTNRGTPHRTDELEYEAYKEMAQLKMAQIAEEIRIKWSDVEGIAIIQRIGKLSPGVISVVIACTASHRDCGIFDAARYGIERLKEIVPIWKKEIGENGEIWVEGDYMPKGGE
jgi:molybdopterin synthase catalytic subunit